MLDRSSILSAARMPLLALRRGLWGCFSAFLSLGLWGCASTHTDSVQVSPAESAWTRASQPDGLPAAPWQYHHFPGKQPTQFQYQQIDGHDAMLAVADSSASMIRQHLHAAPERLQTLKFSWMVPALIDDADMTHRATDDSPVRVMLAFDGDRSRLSSSNAMMSELARALTGEDMPFATLMYVWSNQLPVESTLNSPRTDRIRKIVLESGPAHLGQWLSYERDIRADFERCYGEAPGALMGIAIMTDTDNTQSKSRAFYGPISLRVRSDSAPQ